MFRNTFPWAELPLVNQNDLSDLPPAVSCPVYLTFVENLYGQGQNQKQTIRHPPALLQLRGTHLVLYDPEAKQVLHCWRCQPALCFWIREGNIAVLQQKGEGETNTQALSIVQMSHTAVPQQRLTFLVSAEDKKALEYFGIALEKCAIIQKDFHQKFKPLRKLGKGATAAVYSAVRQRDSSVVAVKAFNKSAHFSTGGGKGKKAFEQELRILTECNHDNLCGFEGVFETQNTIYLVMPSYQRTLTYLLHSSGPIHRQLVTAIMRQLLSGVAYLHDRGVMHRDLKLENIMLYKTEEGIRLTIIDMGMAEFVSSQTYLFEQCGTPGYVAPEIFGKRPPHPQKCDIFSLGVIFHILLFKKPVFSGNSGAQVCLNNRSGKLNIDPLLANEDEAVQELLIKMLEVENSKRISARQALEHDLFASSVKTPELSSAQSDLETSGVLPLLNL